MLPPIFRLFLKGSAFAICVISLSLFFFTFPHTKALLSVITLLLYYYSLSLAL